MLPRGPVMAIDNRASASLTAWCQASASGGTGWGREEAPGSVARHRCRRPAGILQGTRTPVPARRTLRDGRPCAGLGTRREGVTGPGHRWMIACHRSPGWSARSRGRRRSGQTAHPRARTGARPVMGARDRPGSVGLTALPGRGGRSWSGHRRGQRTCPRLQVPGFRYQEYLAPRTSVPRQTSDHRRRPWLRRQPVNRVLAIAEAAAGTPVWSSRT